MIDAPVCPHCGGTGVLDELVDDDDVRRQCADLGIPVTLGDTILEADLARLLEREPKTIANWRHTHQPIPPRRIARRWRYAITDIARFLASET